MRTEITKDWKESSRCGASGHKTLPDHDTETSQEPSEVERASCRPAKWHKIKWKYWMMIQFISVVEHN